MKTIATVIAGFMACWFYSRFANNLEKKNSRLSGILGWVQWAMFGLSAGILVVVYPVVLIPWMAAAIAFVCFREKRTC